MCFLASILYILMTYLMKLMLFENLVLVGVVTWLVLFRSHYDFYIVFNYFSITNRFYHVS